MKKPAVLVAIVGLLLALGGGWWGYTAAARRERIAALLPARPALDQVPATMREKIAAAETDARSLTGSLDGFIALSRLYHANGFLDEAVRCYAGLARLQPAEPRWPHLHATILAGYGDSTPALALWQQTLAHAPDYLPALLRLGDLQLKANQSAAAADTYARVLKKFPGEPYALLGLARIDLEASRWEAAREKLEAVVSKSGNTLGYDLIVTLYEKLGLTERARLLRGSAKASGAYRDPADPWLDALMADCHDPYRLALAAGNAARFADTPGAIALLERAVAIAPDDVSSRYQLGSLLMEQGKRDAALAQIRRCTELAPTFSDGWASLSSLQAQLGQTKAAEQTLAEGLKNCPQSPGLHLQLARNYRDAGRVYDAITEFQTSIRLRPNEADAYLELATVLIKLDREPEAIALLRTAHEAEPGNPAVLGILAFQAISTGDETGARRWLKEIQHQPRVQRDQAEQLRTAYRRKFGRSYQAD